MRPVLFVLLFAVTVSAQEPSAPKAPPPKVETIVQRVWANRARKDFSLKARLFVDREKMVQADILIKNLTDEVRTLYRVEKTALLVVQSQKNLPRFYLAGVGELTTAKQRLEKLLGSWISYYDLGMSFLYWPNPKYVGEDRLRGQDCHVVEVKSDTEPYRRVKFWVQEEYFALLQAEAFDADGNAVKRISITSFKRIGDVWVPRGLDFRFLPPGQALPSSERSRLEVYEGNYDARLPLSDFDPTRFGAKPSAANN
jgi:negative regulator of sigma E activity